MADGRRPPPGPLILLEGLDFSGKSTVATLLVGRLAAAGIHVVHSTSALWPSALLRLAIRAGAHPVARHFRPVVYAALPIADRLFFRRPRGAVTVHEGSIDRLIAFQAVFGSRSLAAGLRAVRPLLIPFDQTITLTADHQERLRRAGLRQRVNDVDRLVLSDPWRLARCDAVLARLTGQRPRALLIDTTSLTTGEVVNRILAAMPEQWRTGIGPPTREAVS
jgi:thymidylate kinase